MGKDRRTDRPTDQPTHKISYRGASLHLKIYKVNLKSKKRSKSQLQCTTHYGRMTRGGHELPKVSLRPAIPLLLCPAGELPLKQPYNSFKSTTYAQGRISWAALWALWVALLYTSVKSGCVFLLFGESKTTCFVLPFDPLVM
jgi:hypothetical protein